MFTSLFGSLPHTCLSAYHYPPISLYKKTSLPRVEIIVSEEEKRKGAVFHSVSMAVTMILKSDAYIKIMEMLNSFSSKTVIVAQ